jgi:hypothetical protein
MAGNSAFLERQTLKEKYLACFGARSSNAVAMVEAVKGLVQLGVTRKSLVQWATAAGYDIASVRSLLSRIFCALGFRERAAGAGRKPTPEALQLLGYAREKYGDRSLNVLRAAWRAGKGGDAVAGFRGQARPTGAAGLNVVPQLQKGMLNCGATIRGSKLNAGRSRAGHRQAAKIISRRHLKE